MPKRKRGDNDIDDVQNLLELGRLALVRNLKIARGFERQKLGRRQKDALAKKDASGCTRIEAEIQALKTLDLQTTAEHRLLKTLHRIKSIASTGLLPPHNLSAPAPATATANVTARLYSAPLVKAALSNTIQQVRQALGLDATAASTAPAGIKAKKDNLNVVTEEEEWQGLSEDLEHCDNAKEPLGSDRNTRAARTSDNGFAEYDGLLASSDEGESDLNSRDSPAAQLKRELAQAVASIRAREDSSATATSDQGHSDASTTTEILSHTAAHSPVQLPDLSTDNKLVVDRSIEMLVNGTQPMNSDSHSLEESSSPKLRTTSSAFFPSLTMGGYWSGSEGDEPENIEEHVAPRKNRRGQRARQAIAEAKFGVAARHVLEGRFANKPKDQRDAGWDMKRGATETQDVRGYNGMGRKDGRSRMKGAREASASGGNAKSILSGIGNATRGRQHTSDKPVGTKSKRDDIGSLHPSWEAKRKAKAATGKIIPFQGKRITFD